MDKVEFRGGYNMQMGTDPIPIPINVPVKVSDLVTIELAAMAPSDEARVAALNERRSPAAVS